MSIPCILIHNRKIKGGIYFCHFWKRFCPKEGQGSVTSMHGWEAGYMLHELVENLANQIHRLGRDHFYEVLPGWLSESVVQHPLTIPNYNTPHLTNSTPTISDFSMEFFSQHIVFSKIFEPRGEAMWCFTSDQSSVQLRRWTHFDSFSSTRTQCDAVQLNSTHFSWLQQLSAIFDWCRTLILKRHSLSTDKSRTAMFAV